MWYIYKMEYNSMGAMGKDIMKFAGKWIQLENIHSE